MEKILDALDNCLKRVCKVKYYIDKYGTEVELVSKQEVLKRLKSLGNASLAQIGGHYVPIEDIKKLITWIERGTD